MGVQGCSMAVAMLEIGLRLDRKAHVDGKGRGADYIRATQEELHGALRRGQSQLVAVVALAVEGVVHLLVELRSYKLQSCVFEAVTPVLEGAARCLLVELQWQR